MATENPEMSEIDNCSYPGYQLDVTNSAIEKLRLSQAHCNELENKLKISALEIKKLNQDFNDFEKSCT